MPRTIAGLPFTLTGLSSYGRCDYFRIADHKKPYFVTTEFNSFLGVPSQSVRQCIATTENKIGTRVQVVAVLPYECRSSKYWALVRWLLSVASAITFITALILTIKGYKGELWEVWWSYFLPWAFCIAFLWGAVVFGVFYKPGATKEEAELYKQLVLAQDGNTAPSLPVDGDVTDKTRLTDNVQVKLSSDVEPGIHHPKQRVEPVYAYDQPLNVKLLQGIDSVTQ